MKPPVYDPSIRDAHPRDLIARGLTVMLWVAFIWICRGLFQHLFLILGIDVSASKLLSPDVIHGIVRVMFKLIGVAYVISVVFFAWRFLTETLRRAARTRNDQVNVQTTGETFGLSEDGVLDIQSRKVLTLEVQTGGRLAICKHEETV